MGVIDESAVSAQSTVVVVPVPVCVVVVVVPSPVVVDVGVVVELSGTTISVDGIALGSVLGQTALLYLMMPMADI